MGLFLIARDNIKKKKGNAAILFLLVALATLLLYTGISVLSNMNRVIDNRNKVVNGADYFLLTMNAHTDEIETILNQRKETAYEEKEKVIHASGVKFYDGEETEQEADQLDFFFLNREADRKLSTIQLIDEGEKWKTDSIILPYYMEAGLGYKTGDIIYLNYQGQTYTFEIYGFTEDVMFSTPMNMSAVKCFISSENFQAYGKEWGNEGTIYRTKLRGGYDTENFEETISMILKEKIPDFTYTVNWSLSYDIMKYGTSVTANMFMGVLTVFSILLIFISLIIVHFNVSNSIEMNIKNIGMLEASGYTSRQMIIATVLEFMIISVLGAGAGLFGATCSANYIGGILSASIGLRWEMGFDLRSAVFSIALAIVLMLLAVLICARRYKKIAPLDALRNGIYAHNFRKNRIRLDTVRLPLNLAIGIKNIVYHKKKNIVVCLMIVLLSFCANEAVVIYQNFAIEKDKMIEITGFEMPDITVDVNGEDIGSLPEKVKEIKQKAASADGIHQIIEYSAEDISCRYGDNKVTVNCDIYDDTKDLKIDNVIDGRRPEYDNEIMLTTLMMGKLGAAVGDVVYLEMNGVSKDYLVVGLSQGINHLGRKGMITKEGMQRLNPGVIPASLYLYTDNNSDLNSVMDQLQEILADESVTITNYQNYVSATMESIVAVMKVLCIVMMTAVILVIAMVLMLLIRMQSVRDQRQIGIYKALGYTTGQLMIQMTMSYIPTVLAGAVLGCILAWFGVNPSFILCLGMFGIKRCSMYISIVYMGGIIFGIVLWAVLIAILSSAKIRKIVPWEMMQEL